MNGDSSPTLLVVGGAADPNILCLRDALSREGVVARLLLLDADPSAASPRVTWDLQTDALVLDGMATNIAAAFIRPDVFGTAARPNAAYSFRASAIISTIAGWVSAHPRVFCVNRRALTTANNKLDVLVRARTLGLRIPATVVTNDASYAAVLARGSIVKPVNGGGLTVEASSALAELEARGSVLPAPAIVQERLLYPELRVYVVGARCVGFRLHSSDLDYREHQNVSVEHQADIEAAHPALCRALVGLAGELGLDFAAADFKCASDGAPVFLEINSMPMFARFDRESHGTLSSMLVRLVRDAPRRAAGLTTAGT